MELSVVTLHAMSLPFVAVPVTFVEPRMMPQWWLNCKQMAADAVESVRSGELQISPRNSNVIGFTGWKIFVIGARPSIGGVTVSLLTVFAGSLAALTLKKFGWLVAPKLKPEKARAKFPEQAANLSVKQDDDVLDTWFSSGLWPLTTLNWPDTGNSDFKRFYPQSMLETGIDILFFWVARMVMMGKYLTGASLHPGPPFTPWSGTHGRKMGKSFGNVIDPVDVVEGCTLEPFCPTGRW